jgi:hypothetical protein
MRSGFPARLSARPSLAALAVLTLSATLGAVAPAAAEGVRLGAGPPDAGDLLFGHAPADDRNSSMPRLARFRADSGDTFILEVVRSGPALLKYDDSGEVWALNPTTGPRGDTIYKNDVGEPMVRTTRLGGLTVFSRDKPSGMAAAFEGGAQDLHNLLVAGPIAIFQVLFRASARASQAAGHRIVFEAGCPRGKSRQDCPAEADVTPGSEAVFADAAALAAQAFQRVENRGELGRAALARYSKVAFVNGRPPGVKVIGEEVRITVTPDLGFAGRPSSQRISQVLFRR